ncbi:MAG: hypothetical protein P8J87_04205 [Verrucomicrobiales bacterium]|nr:hypothetical protein [Verrucomicrobiales bacterium]
MEIDDETYCLFDNSHVVEDLADFSVSNRLDRFALDDDLILNHEIWLTVADHLLEVKNWMSRLLRKVNAMSFEIES